MTSLQTTQAYQVTYDYGKEGALVDALLGGDVPERRTPRKANQAQVAALPDDDDDDGSFGESRTTTRPSSSYNKSSRRSSRPKKATPVPEPSPVQEPDIPEELRQKRWTWSRTTRSDARSLGARARRKSGNDLRGH